MQRYAFHVLLVCALGACSPENDPPATEHTTKCVCKPTMHMELDKGAFCNNATVDWLLHTTMTKVAELNDQLEAKDEEVNSYSSTVGNKEQEIDNLWDVIQDKEDYMKNLEQKLADLQDANSRLAEEKVQLQDQVDKVNIYNAKVNVRPRDCADVQRYGYHYSGLYNIYPAGYPEGTEAFCDLNTDHGGWIVFQRRQDGSMTFDKDWDSYKYGFGKMAKEFWYGNEKLYHITAQRKYELRVDLTDFNGNRFYATYDSFSIDKEADNFKLHLGSYSGNAGDAMSHHDNHAFSTYDNDNDDSVSGNCSELYGGGGWWFVRCYDANLNGVYSNGHYFETVVWYQLHNNHEPMRHVEMKIRPVGFVDQ